MTEFEERPPSLKVSRLYRGLRQQQGSALIELAVTLPVLFLFLFCFMELSLAFYTRDLISECAREGTRYAMYRGASCPSTTNPTCEVTASQVNSYVSSLGFPNLAGGTMKVATTYPNGNENVGSLVQVQVTYNFPITMPLLPANALSMSSVSVMSIIQ
jgi:Flp pilus assembly protein TadG